MSPDKTGIEISVETEPFARGGAKGRRAIREAVHQAIVRLSPYTNHLPRCARLTDAAECNCGLQAELLELEPQRGTR